MKLILIFSVLIGYALAYDLVSNVFGSYMVLQRNQKVAIWGWTNNPKDTVTVEIGAIHLKVKSHEKTNKWIAEIPPQPVGGPWDLTVTSPDSQVTLVDVLFGDVYLCGGQSNMQFTINAVFNATEEINNVDGYKNIRLFSVARQNISFTPLDEIPIVMQPWTIATPTAVNGSLWNYFSAVCWFYGRDISESLNNQVPIGLIDDCWGGTIIQAWMNTESLASCNVSATETENVKTQQQFSPVSNVNPNQNSVLYNAMIYPFLPMSLTGVIWYQGESNCGQFGDYLLYECLFPAMIQQWRSDFKNPNLFFFFVQLSTWYGGTTDNIYCTQNMRLAQYSALVLPKTGFGTAVDLGDYESPEGNIHPRNKQEVGRRLALNARAQIYGQNIQDQGPMYQVASRITPAEARKLGAQVSDIATSLKINFWPDTLSGGLVLNAAPPCPPIPAAFCGFPFEIMSDNNTWIPATPALSSDSQSLILFVNGQITPAGVRSAYSKWPAILLYNQDGLPAAPFYALAQDW